MAFVGADPTGVQDSTAAFNAATKQLLSMNEDGVQDARCGCVVSCTSLPLASPQKRCL